MTWKVTADLDKFDEASTWFASRVPYTKADYDALDDKARKQAFWLSSNLELDGVQTIFDELQHSIDNGTPFEDFKKRVGDKLGALGPGGYHIETVYRNWVQTSYNTGRWYQLQDPDLVHLRPYLMFDAVLDSRTSKPCRACDGIIKRHNDEFWQRTWPPLHHRCRSSVRSLRRGEALARGITQDVPEGTTPQGDFGVAPPLRGDLDHLQPQESRFDPEVWEEFKRRQLVMLDELEAATAQAAAERSIRDSKEPTHWFDTDFKEQYGDGAGRAVAWGKAMEGRGLDMSPKDALAKHATLVRAGAAPSVRVKSSIDKVLSAKGVSKADLDSAHNTEVLRDLAEFAEANGMPVQANDIRGLATLAGHASSINKSPKIEFKDVIVQASSKLADKQLEKKAADLQRFYQAFADASVKQPNNKVTVYATYLDRGEYDFAFRTLDIGDGKLGTMVHEWAHAMDHEDPEMAARAMEFRERRTPFEPMRLMRVATNNDRYKPEEMTKQNGFYDPYMGKVYYEGAMVDYTEVTTMAIQALVDYTEVGDLFDDDPHTLYFALGQLAGAKIKP